MAIIGLVQLTGDARESEVQHEKLDPICSQVFEETSARRRVIENRPELLALLNDASSEDQIVVTKVCYLAQSMVDGLEVLVDLVDRGVAVRVLRARPPVITQSRRSSWTSVARSPRPAEASGATGSRPG